MPGKKSGKHPEKALSATQVRNLTKPGRYADGNGLYLVIENTGSKYWVLRTVIKGKRTDIGLGGVSVVGLAKARDAATDMHGKARAHGDPLEERRLARVVVPTFKEAALQVHKEHAKAFRNVRHAGQWISTLETYVFPTFGDRQVNQIQSGDVLGVLQPIWLRIPETARRVKQRIKMVFDW